MRQLEPFAYFVEHASAMRGFGGQAAGPDPAYCFHTLYEEVAPGRTVYRVCLSGAKASRGELTIRVHAHKPGSGSDVSLVAGDKRRLERLSRGECGAACDLELAVSFAAVEGVQYALYGFFSEPSDLHADAITISLEELGAPTFELAATGPGEETRFGVVGLAGPSRLLANLPPSLRDPTSQDCTFAQLDPETGSTLNSRVAHWWETVPMRVMLRYGFLQEGARGAVMGQAPASLAAQLVSSGCRLPGFGKAADARDRLDFAIAYPVEGSLDNAREQEHASKETLSHLLPGGLAVIMLRYRAGRDIENPVSAWSGRNGIEQLALRLIAAGHDVAQLAFAPASQRVVQDDGGTPFVLVARRARARSGDSR